MKITFELPDPLVREGKASAAERGQSLNEFVADALRDKLAGASGRDADSARPWMRGFGALKGLRQETARIQASIDEQFRVVEPEDRH